MHILYVAKHGNGGNDDEGAIEHALRRLGHEVTLVREKYSYRALRWLKSAKNPTPDFLLFHKWDNPDYIEKVQIPKVCWYFDLVDWQDPVLKYRCQTRIRWMEATAPHTDLLFCTDGDWVRRMQEVHPGKFHHLMQGADERFSFPGTRVPGEPVVPLLFPGNPKGGRQRQKHIADLVRRYRADLKIVKNVHREDLIALIAATDITIAPDAPVTDLYWSNRVYLTLGYGAFLLHPYCALLAEQYKDREEIVFYRSRKEMYELIEHYQSHPELIQQIRAAGYERTIREHTYYHRCQSLLSTVQERLL